MNYCANCGTKLEQGANFCPACGEAVEGAATASAESGGAPSFEYRDGKRHSRIQTHTPDQGSYENDATVEFGDLHPTALWLFFISYVGKSSILLPLIIIGGFLVPWLWALLLVYLLGHYIAAKVTFHHYAFEITPTAFRKEYGIIHKKTSSIPFDRVQNVNINRNLIDRMLGLSHVEIETAGHSGQSKRNVLGGTSSSSEGYIPGIAPEEARDLKDLILRRAQRYRTGANQAV